jgi:hypothetical protein
MRVAQADLLMELKGLEEGLKQVKGSATGGPGIPYSTKVRLAIGEASIRNMRCTLYILANGRMINLRATVENRSRSRGQKRGEERRRKHLV